MLIANKDTMYVPYMFTAKVIVPGTMEKGHYNRKLELWLVCCLTLGSYSMQEPYFSETPGFFAVILVHSAYRVSRRTPSDIKVRQVKGRVTQKTNKTD